MRIKEKKYSIYLAACFMLLFAFNGYSQSDSIQVSSKTKKSVQQRPNHSPTKATLFAFIPGGGQIYNKKYWKLPILYGGIGISAYFAVWNQQQYTIYSDAFDQRLAGEDDPFKDIYTDEQLIQIQNFYSKNRELSIIIGVGIYALSFLDANVDAHLYDFDISDDLSFKIEPASFGLDNSPFVYSGVRFKLNF